MSGVAMLEKLLARQNLTVREMSGAINAMISGNMTPAQTAGFLTALRMKGETIDEVVGAAMAMREHAELINAGAENVVDTCGTGGDRARTFNISTVAAFVAAGAGVVVAKHGNRGVSSKCGSADVLAAAGFNLEAQPETMEQCIQENGIGFLFAPKVHPSMRNVAAIRRELGVRTIFNMLGPLTNPAGATGQVVGVYSPELTEMFAQALKALGVKRAMVVHGQDGLDEITCADSTRVTELRDGVIKTYELFPDIILGETFTAESIRGDGPECNARIMLDVLSGRIAGGPRAITLLNAAAAIMVGGKAETMADGLKLAAAAIDSGAALKKLEIMIEASRK